MQLSLSISKQYLIKPLQTACSIVDRKTTSPILNNTLIKYKQGFLYFYATDMEIQICQKVAIENLPEFAITIAAKKTLDIIKVLADDLINWNISENKIQIQQHNSRFDLQALPSKDFPLMQILNNDNDHDNDKVNQLNQRIFFSISHQQLKHQLHSVAFAMALQDVRYYLNGMLFKLYNQQLIVVATDGHRMSCSKSKTNIKLSNDHDNKNKNYSIEVILPSKTVRELLRLLTDTEEPVNIQMYAGQIIFNLGDIEIISKLIDGKFPDFNRIIPQNHPYLLKLKRSDFQLGLQRVSILTNDKLRAARFILHQQGLSLFASNSDSEEVKEDINAEYNGDGFEVGFNINYWIDIVNILKQDELNISFNNSNTSAVLQTEDDYHTYQYVVMPMRI